MLTFKQFLENDESYHGSHTAPTPDSGSPMHKVSPDVYPHDFHGPNGFKYYADQGNSYDRLSYNKVRDSKDNPDALIKVHRAIPLDVYKKELKSKEKTSPLSRMIRKGDWVSTSREYAKEHGESSLAGKFKVVGRTVRAKHLFTDGNSIHEWGYHPDSE